MLSRMEHDSIGALNVPAEAYYGVQSMRAATNFQITHRPLHPVLIDSIVMVKKAAAITNEKSGKLDQQIAQAIIQACDEILDGNLRDQFIVDAIQGGAGTSANMNANEVIANRAIEILGGTKGDYSIVHPNDHVNMSQSTNDVIPTAGKITVLKLLPQTIKELEKLEKAMEEKEAEFDDILKMGRTQLQDAVPMRLGQSFGTLVRVTVLLTARLSHSEIFGSRVICTYPKLIAAYHVLHRLREPRHPPYALSYFLYDCICYSFPNSE